MRAVVVDQTDNARTAQQYLKINSSAFASSAIATAMSATEIPAGLPCSNGKWSMLIWYLPVRGPGIRKHGGDAKLHGIV